MSENAIVASVQSYPIKVLLVDDHAVVRDGIRASPDL